MTTMATTTTKLSLQDILSDLSVLSPSTSSAGAHPLLTSHIEPAPPSETRRYIEAAQNSIRLNSELIAADAEDHATGIAANRKTRSEKVTRVDYLHARIARLQTKTDAWVAGLETALEDLNKDGGHRMTQEEEAEVLEPQTEADVKKVEEVVGDETNAKKPAAGLDMETRTEDVKAPQIQVQRQPLERPQASQVMADTPEGLQEDFEDDDPWNLT